MFILEFLKYLHRLYGSFKHNYPMKSRLGYCGRNGSLEYPVTIDSPRSVFLAENARIRHGCSIINTPNEKVYIGKYTVLAPCCMLIANNHHSTVSIPHFLLGASHINDKSSDLHIGEDVWCGARAVVLSGADLGRGCIVAANSVVNKPVPPYAVVAGAPAKIIAVKFSIEQILEHEKALYPEKERFSREYLDMLFAEHFEGKKVFGTSDGIDDQAREKLEETKKILHYIDWQDSEK